MDAYCNYLRQLAEQRIAELRREATEARLARSLGAAGAAGAVRQAGGWSGLRVRLQRRAARRGSAPSMAEPVHLPHPRPDAVVNEDLRRSA